MKMNKKHIELAIKALYSKERTLQNSFHAMYRSLENAKTYKELNMNIESILKRIDSRQAEILEVTTAIYYFETLLEELENE